MKRLFILLLAVYHLAPIEPAVALKSGEPTDLRGYGKVSAGFSDNQAVFQCVDAPHADILLGKLLADLFWDAGSDHIQRSLNVGGVAVAVHAWAPYGVLAVGRIGSQVVALGAADDETLRALLGNHPEFLKGSPVFVPEKPYPRYLDHYDLRAFKSYVHPMTSQRNLGLDSHWPFVKKFGLGGIGFQSVTIFDQSPAPGVANFASSDYEFRVANQQDGVISIGLGAGGEVPLWIYNLMPDDMMQPSPTTQFGAWNGFGPTGAHFESWWIPAERRASGSLSFMRQAMERYRDNPALSAWHLYSGAPGLEFGYHGRSTQFWDYSPTGVAGMRSWLRDERKLDLKQLGQRWYGDPARFTSWDQVEIPDTNAFFGGGDPSSERLKDGWQWASARDGIQNPPSKDDPAWIPLSMPPSQEQMLLPWGEAFYRVEFDGTKWAARPQAWLACSVLAYTGNPTVVWLNGVQVASTPTGNGEPLAIPVAGKLKPGLNELVLRVPRSGPETAGAQIVGDGKIFGPIYITANEPKKYPFLGEFANARFVDVRDWQAAGMSLAHRTMLDIALAIDPDHPFNISASATAANNQVSALAEDYGTGVQHTGAEGWYHPWWNGIGLLGGFYGTSEESGTASASALTRELSWLMIDGDSSHNLFWDIEDYQLEEQRSGWFTKNKRAIQCYGKYLRAMPRIAIYRSGKYFLLNMPALPFAWDIGLSELPFFHYDNAYASETELKKGLVDACPVLIDSGTEIMTDDDIQALQRYISRGGTFIALHQTGKDSDTIVGAQPLARLTGLIATEQPANKRITLEENSLLFKGWDRKLEGSGVALIPAPAGVAVPGGEPQAIARWDDGSIAISQRTIGKGRIIQIGSPFWRFWSRDTPGTSIAPIFWERLLTDLGVTRDADASSDWVWARKATTKNGLQDWLLTFNANGVAHTSDVRMAVAEKPSQVWDLLSGAPVASTYDHGFVTIPDVSFGPWATRLFAVKRADLVDGLPFWWGEKVKYWKRPPASSSPGVKAAERQLAAPIVQSGANAATISFSQWRFLADRDGSVSSGTDWIGVDFNDRAWKPMNSGAWNMIDPSLSDWLGTSLYRAAFTVPDAWNGRRIILHFYSDNSTILYDQGEFFINGSKVAEYKINLWCQAYEYDVTSLLRPGTNVLAVCVRAGKQFGGICGSVWLEPEQRFVSQVDIGGDWQVVKADYHTRFSAPIPGNPTGRYLERDFDLPADWAGKSTYLHLESIDQFVCVVVNGKLITKDGMGHQFPLRLELNLTPYLVPGRNHIELWPRGTVPSNWALADQKERPMSIRAIRLELVGPANKEKQSNKVSP